MDLRENITPETLEKIEIPTILISQSQLLEISPSRRKKTESGINAISDRISGETAHAAPAKSLIPFEGFRDTDFDTIHLPAWVGSLISLCLLLLAILSAIWFVVKLRNIQYRNARYKFTSVFFENHRESLRSSYLRTPHSHRRHSRPSQPWAVSLCALMVRFATNRQSDPDVNCPISKRVVKRLTKTPYAARAEVFGFIPMVQDRLYFDIDSLSADKLSPLKPYQFGHSKFFSNKARKNKLK